MANSTFVEQDIQITSVVFAPTELRFVSFPRKLIYKGREYVLAETK